MRDFCKSIGSVWSTTMRTFDRVNTSPLLAFAPISIVTPTILYQETNKYYAP